MIALGILYYPCHRSFGLFKKSVSQFRSALRLEIVEGLSQILLDQAVKNDLHRSATQLTLDLVPGSPRGRIFIEFSISPHRLRYAVIRIGKRCRQGAGTCLRQGSCMARQHSEVPSFSCGGK
jgi:hypothetical protein